LNKAIRDAAAQAAPDPTKIVVTVRFTHLYSDGPAPYWTVIAIGTANKQLEEWDRIKAAVTRVLIEYGSTTTHHHAVGRDHAPFYMREKDNTYLKALFAAKAKLDPHLIMNPGILFPLEEISSLKHVPVTGSCKSKL